MEDNISKIKDRIDIVDLVGSYIKLQKAGVNFKARCPFHNEKSGSFFVSPERQIWHCFGCSLGGDCFGFIKEIENVEFPEALRILASRAGVQLTSFRPEQRDAKSKLYEINELATHFFEKQLYESTQGKRALQYLKDRGLKNETIKAFRLGYSPDSWDSLHNFLERNYSPSEVVSAGLSIKKDRGDGYFDRFRSRIMFPLTDSNNQSVGFTGRVFGELAKKKDVGKYVNTPQTLIYDKSKILYGLDRAKLDIRRSNKCIVVEGNMDVIASNQAGVSNVIASSGTALTDQHLRILRRYTDSIDLCFDADEAGDVAARRGIGLALARGFNVGILSIDEPDLKDPADYIKKYGMKWAEYIKGSKPFLEAYFAKALKTFDISSAQGKKEFSQMILPMVAAISNKVEQSHWVGEMGLVLKVNEQAIKSELTLVKSITSDVGSHSRDGAKISETIQEENQIGLFEDTLLGMIIRQPTLASTIDDKTEEILSPRVVKLCKSIKSLSKSNSRYNREPGELIDALSQDGLEEQRMSLEFAYLKSQSLWHDFDEIGVKQEFEKLLNYIKKRRILAQLESLELDIKSAERARDNDKLNVLLNKFSRLSQNIAQ